jgi:uncharacterized protein
MTHETRDYRQHMRIPDLAAFRVVVQETDLHIQADGDLSGLALASVLRHRGYLEAYIREFPEFARALVPWPDPGVQPAVIARMVRAGAAAGVGPMAAVAGAIAERVAADLLTRSRSVVVENGGDLYLKVDRPVTIAVFAGTSPLSMKIGLRVDPSQGLGVCTSSGTVGHSLSLGVADAVCVLARDAALADAAATAIGNRVLADAELGAVASASRRIADIDGVLIVRGAQLAAWGAVEVIPLKGKKG